MAVGTILLVVAVAEQCYALHGDDSAFCRAASLNNPSFCYSIQDPDKRAMCRASVADDSSVCLTIPDPEKRAICLALARSGK